MAVAAAAVVVVVVGVVAAAVEAEVVPAPPRSLATVYVGRLQRAVSSTQIIEGGRWLLTRDRVDTSRRVPAPANPLRKLLLLEL